MGYKELTSLAPGCVGGRRSGSVVEDQATENAWHINGVLEGFLDDTPRNRCRSDAMTLLDDFLRKSCVCHECEEDAIASWGARAMVRDFASVLSDLGDSWASDCGGCDRPAAAA